MPETEMVERVGRAIEIAGLEWLNERREAGEDPSWDEVPNDVFAKAAIKAYTATLAEAGMVIVPSRIAEETEENRQRAAEIRQYADERRESIRKGARRAPKTFRL